MTKQQRSASPTIRIIGIILAFLGLAFVWQSSHASGYVLVMGLGIGVILLLIGAIIIVTGKKEDLITSLVGLIVPWQ